MKRIEKIFIGFALVIGLAVIAFSYFSQIWITLYVKESFSREKNPELYQIPQERQVKTVEYSIGNYVEFSYSGIRLKTPWTEIKRIEEWPMAKRAFFDQDNKTKSLLIFNAQKASPLTFKETLLGYDPRDIQKIKEFFGEERLKSNYNFYKLVLEASPEQINILTPPKEAMAKFILIILKQGLALMGEEGIYSFSVDNIKGFQFGTPGKSEKMVIDFFDNNDNQYTLLISGTQEEIDFILGSIEIIQ